MREKYEIILYIFRPSPPQKGTKPGCCKLRPGLTISDGLVIFDVGKIGNSRIVPSQGGPGVYKDINEYAG